MKTFRLIGMALLAVVMCVNFTSCSDDDEPAKNDDGVITNQKRLVEIAETFDDYGTNIISFSYDSKGRLISVVQKDYDVDDSDVYNITWGENTVTESEDGESITYSLTDGLVRTGSETNGTNYSFAYNSSKQLTTYQYSDKYYSSTRTLTWENGKVTKITYNKDISEITYGNQTCKGYFPFMVTMVEDDFKVMLAHPELVGLRTTQLPSQINSKGNNWEDKEEYTYKFDKDGYVETCTATYKRLDNNETRTETTIYTFKWE